MYPTTQQPYPQQYPVHQQPNNMPVPSQYPPYPPPYSQAAPYPAGGGYAAPYPAGPYYGQCPQHQQPIIYAQQQQQQRPRGWRPNLNDPNTCWLLSLLTLCCGCLLGEALCDEQCCCCLIPCALPRFRR